MFLCRNQISILQQRSETASNKAKSLVTEILEVKKHLQETKAQHMAGKEKVLDLKLLDMELTLMQGFFC